LEAAVERLITDLVDDFAQGKLSRRQLIRHLTLVAAAVPAATGTSAAQTGKGFKAFSLDHVSYQVRDYRRSRDWYADVLGMTITRDNGKTGCDMRFGPNSRLAIRTLPQGQTTQRVDHVAYWIEEWDTDRVKAELDRRGLSPKEETGGYAGWHVLDPDGLDVQIGGLVKPGDSLYGKKLSEFRP
jgi:catechol 2,3-dioxygenase-like lactoylglutathione lyase family enzyme